MAGLGAAMFTGEVGLGDSVAVFGCGGVGCAAIAGAQLAGATTIIAIDLDPSKLEAAKKFGATHTVDASSTDPVEAVRALTGGNGADVCIEAVGNPKVMEQAFYARDLAGTLVQVGVPTPDMRIELPMIEFFGRGGRAQAELVRRLPARPGTSPRWSTSIWPVGSTWTCSSARPSGSMRSRRPSTVCNGARCCARSSSSDGDDWDRLAVVENGHDEVHDHARKRRVRRRTGTGGSEFPGERSAARGRIE